MTSLRDRALERPSVYQAFKRAIGASRHMDVFVQQYVRPRNGERILDIGCGTGDAVLHLPDVDYVGIDLNESYIEAARHREAPKARFVTATVEDLHTLELGRFHCAIAVGVLHHLSDDVIETMLRALGPILEPAARFVAIDPVWSPDSKTLARLLAAADRGRFVRDDQGYERLVNGAFEAVTTEVRHDLLNIPYSHCITVATTHTSG